MLALVDDGAINDPLKSRSRVGGDGDWSDGSETSEFEACSDLQRLWSEIDVDLSSGVGKTIYVAWVVNAADQMLHVIFRLETITDC